MRDDLHTLRCAPEAGLVSPKKFNALLELLRRSMVTNAGGLARVVSGNPPTIWVDPSPSGGSVAYPFFPRRATEAATEDLPFALSIGTGLVRGQTEYVAPSNAGAEFILEASLDYTFYLEATISSGEEISALTIEFAESDSVPASPTGDVGTGAPPGASYHPFMTISTSADAIDWTTLVHDQSNYILAILPKLVGCDEETLLSVWLRA